MSIIMNQAQVKQQANVKLMDNALDQARTQSADMIKMMEQSMEPHLGTSIDLKG